MRCKQMIMISVLTLLLTCACSTSRRIQTETATESISRLQTTCNIIKTDSLTDRSDMDWTIYEYGAIEDSTTGKVTDTYLIRKTQGHLKHDGTRISAEKSATAAMKVEKKQEKTKAAEKKTTKETLSYKYLICFIAAAAAAIIYWCARHRKLLLSYFNKLVPF